MVIIPKTRLRRKELRQQQKIMIKLLLWKIINKLKLLPL
jgi:hypothetical protein